jgi:hypothetical protein
MEGEGRVERGRERDSWRDGKEKRRVTVNNGKQARSALRPPPSLYLSLSRKQKKKHTGASFLQRSCGGERGSLGRCKPVQACLLFSSPGRASAAGLTGDHFLACSKASR